MMRIHVPAIVAGVVSVSIVLALVLSWRGTMRIARECGKPHIKKLLVAMLMIVVLAVGAGLGERALLTEFAGSSDIDGLIATRTADGRQQLTLHGLRHGLLGLAVPFALFLVIGIAISVTTPHRFPTPQAGAVARALWLILYVAGVSLCSVTLLYLVEATSVFV